MAPKVSKKPRSRPRNYEIAKGLMAFSKRRMHKKKALWKKKKEAKKVVVKKPMAMVTKQVKGKANGESRLVHVNRLPRAYPTESPRRKLQKTKLKREQHKHSLRKSITPGTILILVAGRHRGKRVVFLKQLSSGLLLVTGPWGLNACPLRRINQIYVIATSTKLDVTGIDIPERLNDVFFSRQAHKKAEKSDKSIYEDTKKEEYKVSDERKQFQDTVDKQLIAIMKKRSDYASMKGYLSTLFNLKKREYPHAMKF